MRLRHWIMMVAVIGIAQTAPLAAETTGSAAEFEAKLEAARARLDAAARELAELHGGMETRFEIFHGPGPVEGLRLGPDKAFLGVLLGPAKGEGVALVGVTPGSGAEQAGLAAGDVVTAVNGVAVAGSARNIARTLEQVAPGEVVTVDYLRDGRAQSANVTTQVPLLPGVQALPVDVGEIAGVTRDFRAAFGGGLRLMDLDADLAGYFGVSGGVLVLRAPPETGLKSGDVVLSIDGVAPADADAARRSIGPGVSRGEGPLEWVVRRHGVEYALSVDPKTLHAGVVGVPRFNRMIRLHGDSHEVELQLEEVGD